MAWLVLGEKLSIFDIIGLLICAFGVYITLENKINIYANHMYLFLKTLIIVIMLLALK